MDHPESMRDTTRDALAVHVASLRALGGERRLGLALELSHNVRELARTGLELRHPDYDATAVTRELIRMTVDDKTFTRFMAYIDVDE